MITIELPWPDADLSPNARVHYMALYRAKEQAKHDAYYLTLSHRFGENWFDWPEAETISVTYTFYPPTNQENDDDNLIASMKAARDGIALALDVDDSCFRTQPVEWGDVIDGGLVKVTLEPME